MADVDIDQEHGSVAAYYQCLKQNRHFRLLWLAETVDNVGSWLNYVATLTLVEKFSNSSLAISAVVLIRYLPSLLLAPVCGVVADRCNRVRVLLVASLLDAVVVAALALVQRPSQVWLLYLLLTVQFTCISFYDPARKALIPLTIPQSQLHLATTIDSFAWSITGAVGASVGGVVASRLGNSACFLLDSLTYLVAAWCAWQLPCALGSPGGAAPPPAGAAARQLKKRQSDRTLALELAHLESEEELVAGEDVGKGDAGGGQQGEAVWLLPAAGGRDTSEQSQGPSHPTKAGRRHTLAAMEGGGGGQQGEVQGGSGEVPRASTLNGAQHKAGSHQLRLKHSDAEEAPLGGHPAAHGDAAGGPDAGGGGGGVLLAAAAAVREAGAALWEGWRYLLSRENRDVAALVTIKCCGSLVWGAVDVLNVRFSQMESMQRWGDASVTLGIIFGTVGFACFCGPLAMNAVVAPRPQPLAWGVAAAFCFLFLGFLLMLVAPNILMLLLSTFVRSIGSATLWIYSTLLLQLRVPNAILGRMSAVEMALFTVTEAASSIFGGAAFDVLHLTLRQTLVILTVIAGLTAAAWLGFAATYGRWSRGGEGAAAGAGGGDRGTYQAVATAEDDGGESGL